MVNRWKTLRVIFASFERPEDRPYSLTWITLQVVGILTSQILMRHWLIRTVKQVDEVPALSFMLC